MDCCCFGLFASLFVSDFDIRISDFLNFAAFALREVFRNSVRPCRARFFGVGYFPVSSGGVQPRSGTGLRQTSETTHSAKAAGRYRMLVGFECPSATALGNRPSVS